jgi:hypothetical protein
MRTPTSSRKQELYELGLGEKSVTTGMNRHDAFNLTLSRLTLHSWIKTLVTNATPETLRSDIVRQFPQLQNIGFQLLKSNGAGSRCSLLPFVHGTDVPSMTQILALRPGIIYIRPFEQLVPVGDNFKFENSNY